MPEPELKGIVAAALTPIDQDGAIDSGRLVRHVETLLGEGCSFVSTFGTTGEGVSFSARERRGAHSALLAAGVPAQKLLPAIMSCAVDDGAAELAELAAMGCAYGLILPPHYYRGASIGGLVAYFEAVYRRAGSPAIGIVLYNIPAMSGIRVTHELVERLRGLLPVLGVKDSTGDLASGLAFVEAFPDLAIFTGDDRVLPPLLAAGGAGMIGGLPNLYASDLVALYHAAPGAARDRLASLAATRIADIDARGGLTALKADLAARYSDPAWIPAAPPLGAVARS